MLYLLRDGSLCEGTLRPRTAGRAGFTAVRLRRVGLSVLAVRACLGTGEQVLAR